MYSQYPYKIILGSSSPRRLELLSKLGFEFTVDKKDFNEESILLTNPIESALKIAKSKSDLYTFDKYSKPTMIITADTIVAIDNKILGKPANEQDAFRMLKLLSNKWHQVITGVCIKTMNNQNIFHSITKVHFTAITEQEINYYINQFKPFDKAGSYGIQEWIGLGFIDKIEGSYSNVVGLPTELLLFNLKKYL